VPTRLVGVDELGSATAVSASAVNRLPTLVMLTEAQWPPVPYHRIGGAHSGFSWGQVLTIAIAGPR